MITPLSLSEVKLLGLVVLEIDIPQYEISSRIVSFKVTAPWVMHGLLVDDDDGNYIIPK